MILATGNEGGTVEQSFCRFLSSNKSRQNYVLKDVQVPVGNQMLKLNLLESWMPQISRKSSFLRLSSRSCELRKARWKRLAPRDGCGRQTERETRSSSSVKSASDKVGDRCAGFVSLAKMVQHER